MTMMGIWEVRMFVYQHGMPVKMDMRFMAIPIRGVLVSMMRIVHMGVKVFQRCMDVYMVMLFRQMQP